MKALLDTHVLLWWLVDSARLSETAREVLASPSSELYWSAASSWELAIKTALGRLRLPEPPRSLIPKVLQAQSIHPLTITHAHALAVAELKQHHRDPFDRLLVVQAQLEGLAVLSANPAFGQYGTNVIW